MDTKCEWKDCEVLTNKRFCTQRCRDRWQYNDPEWRAKKQARNRKYNRDNPDVLARAQKKWYESGGKAVRDAWREANRERYNELIAEWKRNHPEQNVVDSSKRRATLRAAVGTFTVQEWLDVCQAYDFKCAKCGKAEQTVDHVVPLSKGGYNTIDNVQPLCRSCNSAKGVNLSDYRDDPLGSIEHTS